MGQPRKLTPEELAGATEVAAPAAGPRKLTTAELQGAQEVSATAAPETSWLQRIGNKAARVMGSGRGPGATQAVVRGAIQGATLGFADELSAAFEAPFSDKTYQQIRDEYRAKHKADQTAHPVLYGGGELAGSLATPGLGMTKAALTPLQVGVRSAVGSGLAGVGNSEQEGLGSVTDGVPAAIIGGATGGLISKVVRSAPERALRRTVGDITDGATATQRDKVVGAAGKKFDDVIDLLRREKELGKVLRKEAADNPGKALGKVEERLGELTAKLDEFYDGVDKATGGVELKKVLERLTAVRDRLGKDPGKLDMARAVDGKIADVVNTWGAEALGSPFADDIIAKIKVPSRAVRTLASDLGDTAFAGSPGAEKTGAAIKAGRQIYSEIVDTIDDTIRQAAPKGIAVAGLHRVNQDVSNLINIKGALKYRSMREATPSTTLRSRMSYATDVALALSDPTGAFLVKKAWDLGGKGLAKEADYQLAQLVNKARGGSTAAQITQTALELGISRAVAPGIGQWLYEKFGEPAAAQTTETSPPPTP